MEDIMCGPTPLEIAASVDEIEFYSEPRNFVIESDMQEGIVITLLGKDRRYRTSAKGKQVEHEAETLNEALENHFLLVSGNPEIPPEHELRRLMIVHDAGEHKVSLVKRVKDKNYDLWTRDEKGRPALGYSAFNLVNFKEALRLYSGILEQISVLPDLRKDVCSDIEQEYL